MDFERNSNWNWSNWLNHFRFFLSCFENFLVAYLSFLWYDWVSFVFSSKYVFNLFVVQSSFFSLHCINWEGKKPSPLIPKDLAQNHGYDSILESQFLFCHVSCSPLWLFLFVFLFGMTNILARILLSLPIRKFSLSHSLIVVKKALGVGFRFWVVEFSLLLTLQLRYDFSFQTVFYGLEMNITSCRKKEIKVRERKKQPSRLWTHQAQNRFVIVKCEITVLRTYQSWISFCFYSFFCCCSTSISSTVSGR